ncbi:MAG TPA: hypothetical protein VJ755_09185 [Gemmatimonadales bacterium]|nr:hypothetical protein [Gemmatimonadales bacterium]
MRTRLASTFSLGLATLLAVTACGEKARGGDPTTRTGSRAVAVTQIDLGRSLNTDLTIKDNTDTFRPSDVIYASVETKGSGSATLGARWTDGNNQLIDETSRTISASDEPARTEFHISKTDGWPQGKYKVTVFVNGTEAGSKDFEVKR